jgi:hypothetical protein
MNIIIEIDRLPRQSRLALAAHVIKQDRPSIGQLADAAGADDNTVRGWLGIRSRPVLDTIRP